jgi:hypothetical protein
MATGISLQLFQAYKYFPNDIKNLHNQLPSLSEDVYVGYFK